MARLVREFGLVRECVPTRWLSDPAVWDALLDGMPLGAMVRNLGTMTRVGLLAPGSEATTRVAAALADQGRLRRSRVHPVAVLTALRTYAAGRGVRGAGVWTPVPAVVDALDAAFYTAFAAAEPTGKRWLLALDVSGSMGCGAVAGVPNLTPREASAAMALVTAATEPAHTILGFSHTLVPVGIGPGIRLDDAVRAVERVPMGGTDCALPMLYALDHNLSVDVFVVYTDSETWFGDVHPVQALQRYRERTGIPARMAVVGLVSNGFSIADPDDAGMLDVVGFDAAVPPLLAGFAGGAVA